MKTNGALGVNSNPSTIYFKENSKAISSGDQKVQQMSEALVQATQQDPAKPVSKHQVTKSASFPRWAKISFAIGTAALAVLAIYDLSQSGYSRNRSEFEGNNLYLHKFWNISNSTLNANEFLKEQVTIIPREITGLWPNQTTSARGSVYIDTVSAHCKGNWKSAHALLTGGQYCLPTLGNWFEGYKRTMLATAAISGTASLMAVLNIIHPKM